MDDKEYYQLMNKSNSENVLKEVLRHRQTEKNRKLNINDSLKNLSVRQGSADAEMLFEKNDKNGV